jgi:hypothetical protein
MGLLMSADLLLLLHGVGSRSFPAYADSIFAAAPTVLLDETVSCAQGVVETDAKDLNAEEIAGDSWLG